MSISDGFSSSFQPESGKRFPSGLPALTRVRRKGMMDSAEGVGLLLMRDPQEVGMGSKAFSGEVWTNVHPEILHALIEANRTVVDGKVGHDRYSRDAESMITDLLETPAFVFETLNGTAANVLALKTMLHAWGTVICAECTHIHTYECGALEYQTGAKILTVPSDDGKIQIEALCSCLAEAASHGYSPEVLVLTQPTEYGVLYSPGEIRALTEYAHGHGLSVYLDGARLLYALSALGIGLREMIVDTEIDAFSLGGTKVGLLMGEAVVLLRREHALHLEYLQKQSMQHLDKSKFLGAQFCALLSGSLWQRIAGHACSMAKELCLGLQQKGIRPYFPAETNMVFCQLSPEQYSRVLKTYDVHDWTNGKRVVRFCMTHETTSEEIQRLLSLL